MKGKFLFLLPRILGLTLIIGIASLVLGLVFKLLLGLIVIGSIALAIAGIVRFARGGRRPNEAGLPGYGRRHGHPNEGPAARQTIVPIN